MDDNNATSTVASSPEDIRIALFGPQITDWTTESLDSLQNSLQQDTRLEFLRIALASVAGLGPLVKDLLGDSGFPSDQKLDSLQGFATKNGHLDASQLTNTELSPLTVISQTIRLIQLVGQARSDAALSSFRAAQGFCIGFLSAAAFASSHTWAEYETNISNAVRLAAIVGIAVDAEQELVDGPERSKTVSVRWRTPEDRAYLETCLDSIQGCYVSCIIDHNSLTITLPAKHVDSFCGRMEDGKLPVTHVSLHGSFHQLEHIKAAELISHVCAENQQLLALPNAQSLRLPLRSTASTLSLTEGDLADIAVELILCKRAHWYQTVKSTLVDNGSRNSESKIELVPLGKPGLVIPRSLRFPNVVSPGLDDKEHLKDLEEIAIVGMACRFPQAKDVEAFWELLKSGGSAIGKMPSKRFDSAHITSREPKLRDYWGNFIDNPDVFDHRFFSISGREAKSMDPQQRLALQVAYEAMESSGYHQRDTGSSDTERKFGCYLGVGAVEYENNVLSQDANAFAAVGTLRAFISGRISHFFGWTGPSITFDTACSSSAVAIHTACKALLSGECNMALTGGVNVITSPHLHQNLAAASFLNTKGASKAFDANASGYCRGEGAGMLVLKRLSAAVADGDDVLGVIASSAINQGSNRSPITVPDSGSQSSLYLSALSGASVDPADVSYVEAHGTGTPVGDPIEYESVRLALAGVNREDDLFLGSVKDNIGHAEAASGVAGVIKVILMMQNQTIPKQANFDCINPRIKTSPKIIVPKVTQPWNSRRHVALVNNYGAAGSNAVLLLRSVPRGGLCQAQQSFSINDVEFPIVIAANTESSLQAYTEALQSRLDTFGARSFASLANKIARTQNPSLGFRVAFTASSLQEVRSRLAKPMRSPKCAAKLPVVLCFGGQTGRQVTISKHVYDTSDLFRNHLDECDAVCRSLGLGSIYPEIFQDSTTDDLVRLHCMLLSLQISSANSWIDSGLVVDTLIGHSFGELAALCIAGSLSLLDTFRLVAGRARLIQSDWGAEKGSMLSVECPKSEIESVLSSVNMTADSQGELGEQTGLVDLACYNGPNSFVLAGDHASVNRARAECSQRKLKAVVLGNTNAYHSHLASGILEGLRTVVESINILPPRLRLESCSGGGIWPNAHIAEDVIQHIRRPVKFGDAVERIAARLPSAVWIEAGSSTPIVTMARRVLSSISEERRSDLFVPVDIRDNKSMLNLSRVACELWVAGLSHCFWLFHSSSSHRYTNQINLPPYQFEKSSHWITLKPQNHSNQTTSKRPGPIERTELVNLLPTGDSANCTTSDGLRFWIDTANDAFKLAARGHAVTGQSLCPASMYIELAVTAAKIVYDTTNRPAKPEAFSVPHVENMIMSAPLGLNTSARVLLRLQKVGEDTWDFAISSQPFNETAAPTEHAKGRLSWVSPKDTFGEKRLKVLQRFAAHGRKQLSSPRAAGISGGMIYKLFDKVVTYADYYRGVISISASENEAMGLVMVPPQNSHASLDDNVCDPIVLDNFLQVAGIHVNCLSPREEDQVFMCTELQEVIFTRAFMQDRSLSRTWSVYTRFVETEKGTMTNDIIVCDKSSGQIVLAVLGASFHGVRFKSLARNLARLKHKGDAKTSAPVEQVSVATTATATFVSDSSDNDSAKSVLTAKTSISSAPSCSSGKSAAAWRPPTAANGGQTDLAVAPTVQSNTNEIDNSQILLDGVSQLLSSILEIPLEEIKPASTLEEIGVDSLLVTDVLADIQTRYNVSLSQQDFMNCSNILAITKLLDSNIAPSGSAPKHHEKATIPALSVLQDKEPNPTVEHAWQKVSRKIESDLSLADLSRTCFIDAKPTYDTNTAVTGFSGFYDNVFPDQSKLVVKYVLEAFKDLGCDLQVLKPGDIVPDFVYHKKHTKLVPQLYRVIEDGGVITRGSDGAYRRTNSAIPLVAASALHQEMLAKFPGHSSETHLLHTTAPRLAECLTGAVDPVTLIFRDSAARALLEDVYTNAPMFKTGTLLLGQYLSSVVQRVRSTGRQELRILELGAGTGGTSKHIIETLTGLTDVGCKLSYTFTDLSPSLVAAAKRKFARWSSIMEYAVMDIEKEPATHQLENYDIILSTNCIHATKNLVASATNIRKMLRPDGILCLVELTRNLYWFDLVFGLLEGWWLFEDGRDHALAHEQRWDKSLRASGFNWVDWSESNSKESELLRVITASPYALESMDDGKSKDRTKDVHSVEHEVLTTKETVTFKEVDGLKLQMDVHYPSEIVDTGRKLPIALMVHGGGHIMLSKRDIRPAQTALLVRNGFLPVSVDYRLCPETTLLEGPMVDVSDALAWLQTTLADNLGLLKRQDVACALDTSRIVAIGWSTGGHLALTLGWTASSENHDTRLKPPAAIMALYSPTDYEDPFWTLPNIPVDVRNCGSQSNQHEMFALDDETWDNGLFEAPVLSYNVPSSAGRALGGWLATKDARSRVALHMNVQGRTLQMLLGGPFRKDDTEKKDAYQAGTEITLSLDNIKAASPLAQIQAGNFSTPTFLIHPRDDDLIPWQQAERTWKALRKEGVDAELRIVDGVCHLFDLEVASMRRDPSVQIAMEAVKEGYQFLCDRVGLEWKG